MFVKPALMKSEIGYIDFIMKKEMAEQKKFRNLIDFEI